MTKLFRRSLPAVLLAFTACGAPPTPSEPSTTTAASTTTDSLRLQLQAQPHYEPTCSSHCGALVMHNADGSIVNAKPATASTPSGLGATDLENAYGINASAQRGAVVAVVDAYDHPDAESDLAVYRAQFGLPACTTANGCFHKINQDGQASPLPQAQPPAPANQWDVETALDLDMVSAGCPNCQILLVETNADSDQATADSNFKKANASAVAWGAAVVSNSWIDPEFPAEVSEGGVFNNHPGVSIFASAGDQPYGIGSDGNSTSTGWPAVLSTVIAVGGTVLTKNSNTARGWTETAWNLPGPKAQDASGCSRYVDKPVWQQNLNTGCSKRAVTDISAVADNVSIFVTGTTGINWTTSGGSSAATPLVAAMFAGNNMAGIDAQVLYDNPLGFNDITTGGTTTCSVSGAPSVLCTAGPGWDGVTGLGSPQGGTMFRGQPGSQNGALAAVARNPEDQVLVSVERNGIFWSRRHEQSATWTNYLISASNFSVSTHVTAVARNPARIEIYWIGSDGSVNQYVQDDRLPSPVTAQVAPPGSASPMGAISALSRRPNTVEVFYIGADRSVRDSFWYDGYTNWSTFSMTAPYAAAVQANLAAVSRLPGSMEVFYVGANHEVEDLYYNNDGSSWGSLALTAANTVMPGGSITAVSRMPGLMDVFWVNQQYGLSTAFYQNGWGFLSVPTPESIAVASSMTVTTINPTNLRVSYIGNSGALAVSEWDARSGWVDGSMTAGLALNDNGWVAALSRLTLQNELWFSQKDESLEQWDYSGTTPVVKSELLGPNTMFQ